MAFGIWQSRELTAAPSIRFAAADSRLCLAIICMQDYPFQAPIVRFETPCYHPNVDNAGNICLDILKEHWSAAYSVRTVLLSIQVFSLSPLLLSPLLRQWL